VATIATRFVVLELNVFSSRSPHIRGYATCRRHHNEGRHWSIQTQRIEDGLHGFSDLALFSVNLNSVSLSVLTSGVKQAVRIDCFCAKGPRRKDDRVNGDKAARVFITSLDGREEWWIHSLTTSLPRTLLRV
jgi:hypothetical protein